jgi:GAF domain-containing protein
LEKDPLARETIATKELQLWVNAPGATPPVGVQDYQSIGIYTHLLVPVIFRDQLLGVLSLQWNQKRIPLREDELKLIYLAGQQVGLALTSTRSYQLNAQPG